MPVARVWPGCPGTSNGFSADVTSPRPNRATPATSATWPTPTDGWATFREPKQTLTDHKVRTLRAEPLDALDVVTTTGPRSGEPRGNGDRFVSDGA